MKSYAYAEKKGEGLVFFLFEKNRSVDSSFDYKALMMSRLDVDVRIIGIPPIPEKAVHDFLRYKIRSFYPGNPEETVFDYRLFLIKKKKYAAVFITQKDILSEYKNISRGKPMFLPFTLILPFLGMYENENTGFVFVHPFWIDLLLINSNEEIKSYVIKRSVYTALDINRIADTIPERNGRHNWIFFCSKADKDLAEKQSKNIVDSADPVEFISIENALATINKNTRFLFKGTRQKSFISRKWRIQLLLFIALFLCALVFRKSVIREERYLNSLKENIEAIGKETSRSLSLQNEIEISEEEVDALNKRIHHDPYYILSELKTIFERETDIQSFILEKDFFQLEAIGPNPLHLMDEFRSKEIFKNVKIVQIVPLSESNRELYKITGSVNAE